MKPEKVGQATRDAEIAEDLLAIAQTSLSNVRKLLPQDLQTRFAIFVEACRIVDVLAVTGPMDRTNGYENIDIQLMQLGWNLAAATLLAPLSVNGAIPLAASTDDSRREVADLLRSFGCVVHIRRVAEMVRGGLLDATVSGRDYRFKLRNRALPGSFADNLAFDWVQKFDEHERRVFGSELDDWICENIEDRMRSLVRPWHTKFGTMAAYDTEPEIDDHFAAQALEFGVRWRTEAAIHPDGMLGGVQASILIAIAIYYISFHVKHAQFVQIAAETYSAVGVHQSMTIWKERKKSIETLVDLLDISPETANQAIDALALKASEVHFLETRTSPIRPLLIDLGNGLDLWIVSSLSKNPFHSIRAIHEWRDPASIRRMAERRESWMRTMIHGLFEGTRYIRVEGAIQVRKQGKIVTDIDAAVYDTVDDELALFQIKWQDFDTNNPRQLRSKASNFLKGMRKWNDAVIDWMSKEGMDNALRAMRIEQPRRVGPTKVFLFGVSYMASRVDTLTGDERPSKTALASWPQFVRARYETGPVANVFQKLHARLLDEAQPEIVTNPLPMSIQLCGRMITLDDVFNSVSESGEPITMEPM